MACGEYIEKIPWSSLDLVRASVLPDGGWPDHLPLREISRYSSGDLSDIFDKIIALESPTTSFRFKKCFLNANKKSDVTLIDPVYNGMPSPSTKARVSQRRTSADASSRHSSQTPSAAGSAGAENPLSEGFNDTELGLSDEDTSSDEEDAQPIHRLHSQSTLRTPIADGVSVDGGAASDPQLVALEGQMATSLTLEVCRVQFPQLPV